MEFILFLVIGIVIYAVVKAKTRIHYANQMGAAHDMESGQGRTPSWAMNPDRREEFVKTIQALALRKGVPHNFIVEKLEDKDIFRLFVQYSGALEHRNSSFAEQQVAIGDLICKMWGKLGDEAKDRYTEASTVAGRL